jgi:hypothetical protein
MAAHYYSFSTLLVHRVFFLPFPNLEPQLALQWFHVSRPGTIPSLLFPSFIQHPPYTRAVLLFILDFIRMALWCRSIFNDHHEQAAWLAYISRGMRGIILNLTIFTLSLPSPSLPVSWLFMVLIMTCWCAIDQHCVPGRSSTHSSTTLCLSVCSDVQVPTIQGQYLITTASERYGRRIDILMAFTNKFLFNFDGIKRIE